MNRRSRFIALLAALTWLAAPQAEALLGTGMEGLWTAETLMAANPPLPALRARPGSWRLTLAPAWYKGSPGLSDTDAASYMADGSFKGLGGGACLSYAFDKDWGAYLWALGSKSSGDALVTPRPGCASCSTLSFPAVDASYQVASAGLIWRAAGGEPGAFTLPVFAGAIVSHTRASQTVRRTASATLLDDFDMEVEQTVPGLALGAQAGVPLGRNWELNPFLLGAYFFSDGCVPYSVSRQGVDNGQSGVSTVGCAGPRELEVGEAGFALALGVNLTYLPWSLSVNLTAPYLGGLLAREFYGEHADVALLSFSWHYGR